MAEEKETLRFELSDLLGFKISQLTCTNCIEGYCPARTPSECEGTEFILCGAKKLTQPVLDAYRARTGSNLKIEHPC